MIHDLAIAALQTSVRLRLNYNGFSRVVEVHAVGESTAGNPCMRVFQTAGGSASEPIGWKLMTFDNVVGMHLTEEISQGPRGGYARNDRNMRRIFAQL